MLSSLNSLEVTMTSNKMTLQGPQEASPGKNSPANAALHQTLEIFLEVQHQVEQGEKLRKRLEEKVVERQRFFEDFSSRFEDLAKQKAIVDSNSKSWEAEVDELRKEVGHLRKSTNVNLADQKKLLTENGSLLRKLHAAESEMEIKKGEAERDQQQIAALNDDLIQVRKELKALRNKHEELVRAKSEIDVSSSKLDTNLQTKLREIGMLKQQSEILMAKVSALASMNALAAGNMEKLLGELAKSNSHFEKERQAKQLLQKELNEAENRIHELHIDKQNLQHGLDDCRQKLQEVVRLHEEASNAAIAKEKVAQERITAQQSLIEAAAREKRKHEEELASFTAAMQTLKHDKEGLSEDLRHAKEENDTRAKELLQQIKEKETSIEELLMKLQEYEAKHQATLEELAASHEANNTKVEEYQKLEEEQSKLREEYQETLQKVAEAERAIQDSKKEAATQLEAKQLELQKHLRELSQQNNQAVAEMRKQYETEAAKAIETEKTKAFKMVEDAKGELDKLLAEERDKAQASISNLQETQKTQILEMAQIHSKDKEEALSAQIEEWKRKETALLAAIQQKEKSVDELESQKKEILRKHQEEVQCLQNNFNRKLDEELENARGKMEQPKDEKDTIEGQLQKQKAEVEGKLQETEKALQETKEASQMLKEAHALALEQMKRHFEVQLQEYKSQLSEVTSKNDAQRLEHEAATCKLKNEYEKKLQEAERQINQPCNIQEEKAPSSSPTGVAQEPKHIIDENVTPVLAAATIQVDSEEEPEPEDIVLNKRPNQTKPIKTKRRRTRMPTKCGPGDALLAGAVDKPPKQKRGAMKKMNMQPIPDSDNEDTFFRIIPPGLQRQITSHEYEVETSEGGKKVTKRKRTKSTVTFGEASSIDAAHGVGHKPAEEMSKIKAQSASIGELFGSGSLNPYQDDPYAFD